MASANYPISTISAGTLNTTLTVVAPKQIVFIDRNITDYSVLTAGVLPGIATVLLDVERDGIDRITEVLARHRGLTAIHIVSHGGSGSVQLGHGYLGLDNLAEYTDSLRSWSKSLAADAEILLYGCEVAQGDSGAALVAGLGELTQVRVVAKATKTGNPELGGDWNLAASVPLAFTPAVMASCEGVLANSPVNFTLATNFTVGNPASSIVIGDLNGDGLPDLIVGNVGSKDVSVLLNNSDKYIRSTISIADTSITEGNTGISNAAFTVTLSSASAETVTVDYKTSDGTATSGSDYQPVSGTATFAAGAATASVNLTVIDDKIFEGDTPETAILTLTPSTEYLIGSSNIGTINIADNDPRPTISINSVAIAEGNTGTSNAGFTVSLSNASTEAITVNLSTQDGTATADSDYTALTNQLVTFAPGQTSQVVNVAVNGDTEYETNETFSAVLSNASNGSISSTAGTGTGTINNDDLPTITVAATIADAVAQIIQSAE